MLILYQGHHLCIRQRCPHYLPRVETIRYFELTTTEGRERQKTGGGAKVTEWKQQAKMNVLPKGNSQQQTSVLEKKTGTGTVYGEAGCAHGDRQDENQDEVFLMW